MKCRSKVPEGKCEKNGSHKAVQSVSQVQLMCESCHIARMSNDKFSVEFWIFVIVMFLATAKFWNLGHL